MIGVKRPSENHFDASYTHQNSKRARTGAIASPGRQLLRKEPSWVTQAWGVFVSLFASTQGPSNTNQSRSPRKLLRPRPPSQRAIEHGVPFGSGQIVQAISQSNPGGSRGLPTSIGNMAAGKTRDLPVDLTSDHIDSESSDDPLAEPVPNDHQNPGPSQRNIASGSRSYRKYRDGSGMQIGAERKGRTYGWESVQVHGGGNSSSNPISIEDESESESEPHKNRRRPQKDAFLTKISALESQLAKLKREMNEARDGQDRIRLQRDYNSVGKVLERTRVEEAESKRAVLGGPNSTTGTDSRAAYAEILQRQTSRRPHDSFLVGQVAKPFVPRAVLRGARIAHHETGQDISQILEKVKIAKDEELAAYLSRQKPVIPKALPSDQAQAVRSILERPTAFKSPKCFNEVIEQGNIKRLKSGQWLSDDIMAYYAGLIMKRNSEAEDGKFPKIHYFNTFFYSKLQKQGYSSLRRWTKKIDLFDKDMVLVPINVGNMHWIAAVINFKQKRIEYFDSMGNYGESMREVFSLLQTYVKEEHKDKKGSEYDMSGWKHVHSQAAPQQANGSDCGVFSCQTLELVARGADPIDKGFEFSSKNMEFFRQLMIHEISVGELRKRW